MFGFSYRLQDRLDDELYSAYLQEIEDRKGEGLHAKPIDDAALLSEVIDQIKDPSHPDREASLHFFAHNVLPGTTSAAGQGQS